MPSIYPYVIKHGGDEWFFAACLFIYSLGELIGALSFGYMHNFTKTKTVFYTVTTLGILSGMLYFSADYFGGDVALGMIISARFCTGLWTGGEQALEQAYISEVVDKPDTMKLQSEMGIACVSGFIIGPLLGLALSFVDISLGPIVINTYTCPGYIIFIGTLSILFQTAIRFKEVKPEDRPHRNPTADREIEKPNTMGLICVYIFCLFCFNSLAVQETITTPLITDVDQKFTNSFDWNVTAAYTVYAGSGVLSIFVFVAMHFTSGKIDDRWYNMIGLAFGIIGWLLLVDYNTRQISHACFFTGYALVAMAFPIVRIVSITMLGKVIGPRQAGGYFGWFLCIGAVARCAGPFWAIKALSISARLCFGSTAAFMAICLIIQICFFKKTQPHPEYLINKKNN